LPRAGEDSRKTPSRWFPCAWHWTAEPGRIGEGMSLAYGNRGLAASQTFLALGSSHSTSLRALEGVARRGYLGHPTDQILPALWLAGSSPAGAAPYLPGFSRGSGFRLAVFPGQLRWLLREGFADPILLTRLRPRLAQSWPGLLLGAGGDAGRPLFVGQQVAVGLRRGRQVRPTGHLLGGLGIIRFEPASAPLAAPPHVPYPVCFCRPDIESCALSYGDCAMAWEGGSATRRNSRR
jgi:hypothetical protein